MPTGLDHPDHLNPQHRAQYHPAAAAVVVAVAAQARTRKCVREKNAVIANILGTNSEDDQRQVQVPAQQQQGLVELAQ